MKNNTPVYIFNTAIADVRVNGMVLENKAISVQIYDYRINDCLQHFIITNLFGEKVIKMYLQGLSEQITEETFDDIFLPYLKSKYEFYKNSCWVNSFQEFMKLFKNEIAAERGSEI